MDGELSPNAPRGVAAGPERWQPWISTALVLACLAASGLISLALGQDTNWDLRNYHFYNPWALLHGRLLVDLEPANIQTYYNPASDLLFYALVTHVPPRAVGFVLGALHGGNFLLLYLIAVPVLRSIQAPWPRALAPLTAAVGAWGPTGASEHGATFNDNLVSLFLLGSLALLVYEVTPSPSTSRRTKAVVGAGALAGVGVGLKLTQGPYAVALMIALVAASQTPFLRRWAHAALFGVGTVVGVALSAGYWMAKLWVNFGSPLFPYYNGIFHSPLFPFDNYRDDRWTLNEWREGLLKPFLLIADHHRSQELDFGDLRYALLAGALLLSAGFGIYRGLRHRAPGRPGLLLNLVTVTTVISFIGWELEFGYYRYLYFVEALSPLALAGTLSRLAGRRWLQLPVILSCLALIAVTSKRPDWGRRRWSSSFFGVDLPPTPGLEHSAVLFLGEEALSYLAPFVPGDPWFTRVTYKVGLSERRLQFSSWVGQADRPFFCVATRMADLNLLSPLGLRARRADCRWFGSAIEEGGRLLLCPVDRQLDRPGRAGRAPSRLRCEVPDQPLLGRRSPTR